MVADIYNWFTDLNDAKALLEELRLGDRAAFAQLLELRVGEAPVA